MRIGLVVGLLALASARHALADDAPWQAAVTQKDGAQACQISGASGPLSMNLTASLAQPHNFTIGLDNAGWSWSDGSTQEVAFSFDGNVQTIAGAASGSHIDLILDSSNFPAFLHGFTAGTQMALSLPGAPSEPWSFSLKGTTQAVTAMGHCTTTFGFRDLPAPFAPAPLPAVGAQAPNDALSLKASLGICRATPDSLERLRCYDALAAGNAPLAPPSSAPEPEAAAPPAPPPSAPQPETAQAAQAPSSAPHWEGQGTQTTEPFREAGPWKLSFQADDHLHIDINQTGQSYPEDTASTGSNGGSGSTYVPQGGEFYLHIEGFGNWSITATAEPTAATTPQLPMAETQASASDASSPTTPPPNSGATTGMSEDAFLQLIEQYKATYQAAPNEMAGGGARAARASVLCQVTGGNLAVTNWHGTIDTLSSNNSGKGVVVVRVADGVTVGTWNNALSDASTATMIDPSSALFAAVSRMQEGEAVIFSGTFFSSTDDCLSEKSLTQSGSMTSPDFVFRFSDVRAASP